MPVVDRALSERFRDGDPEAVRAIYRTYGRVVYAVAFKLLGDRGLAEEATQQAFVKAWRAAESFDLSRELGPWLASIARRAAIDIYRRESVRPADPLESVAPGDPALVSEPESGGDRRRLGGAARPSEQLPADEQEVVRLQHLRGTDAQRDRSSGLNVAIGHRQVEVVQGTQAAWQHCSGTYGNETDSHWST